MGNVVTKILKMIESTRDSMQGLGTRRYIDLYYIIYGTSQKKYIEKIFSNKLKSFYTL
jgi:hypothetical protein|tara:strand:- start:6564 stop:6737 length:174 start_codon:yes stop_codon:yes gene_type:complete